jgi:acyl carrier protein
MNRAARRKRMTDVENKVLNIIASKASVPPETLTREAKLSDLNIASLDVVEIVFALEELFDIQIPFNANKAQKEFESVGDVVRAVESLLSNKA